MNSLQGCDTILFSTAVPSFRMNLQPKCLEPILKFKLQVAPKLSNSSGDIKVPSQQKISFLMDWFLSRYMALFRLQISCSFGLKWDDCVDWRRSNIWKEGTDQFHSPTKTRTCVLQNINSLGIGSTRLTYNECLILCVMFTARQRINLKRTALNKFII